MTRVVVDSGLDGLLERVRRDDEFVRAHGLQAVRETLTLAYPSYILALAMGAGKTILIGAIIATEFAMAMEYPEGGFVENALVFAPGKTILESLKELIAVPYDRILPPRLHKRFAASVKLTFTRDGEKDLPVIRGSSFNVVVRNTEKIRIRKEDVRKSDVAGSIHSYDFEGRTEQYVSYVIEDFFAEYGNVALPNGAPAKLALYFPQTDDLAALKPVVDAAMTRAGLGPAACLVNTSDSRLTRTADIDAFNRLNDPAAPHRVMLLVNKGTEGWNCPSLFACALVRKLRTSNNFVLQAATRCLRQVPGNTHKARIYLSSENFAVLDKQLQETYGESIATLNADTQERRAARVVLRRVPIPPLLVRQIVRTVARREPAESTDLTLQRPEAAPATATGRRYTVVADLRGRHVLQPVGDGVAIADTTDPLDVRTVAVDFAAQYRLDPLDLVARLRAVYPSGEIPPAHIGLLAEQVEAQTRRYETREEQVDVALALVKEDGFERETDATGAVVYTAQIVYPVAKEKLLVDAERRAKQNAAGYGFFISPLRFDSEPEISFFDQVLSELNLSHLDVEDAYYTR